MLRRENDRNMSVGILILATMKLITSIALWIAVGNIQSANSKSLEASSLPEMQRAYLDKGRASAFFEGLSGGDATTEAMATANFGAWRGMIFALFFGVGAIGVRSGRQWAFLLCVALAAYVVVSALNNGNVVAVEPVLAGFIAYYCGRRLRSGSQELKPDVRS